MGSLEVASLVMGRLGRSVGENMAHPVGRIRRFRADPSMASVPHSQEKP